MLPTPSVGPGAETNNRRATVPTTELPHLFCPGPDPIQLLQLPFFPGPEMTYIETATTVMSTTSVTSPSSFSNAGPRQFSPTEYGGLQQAQERSDGYLPTSPNWLPAQEPLLNWLGEPVRGEPSYNLQCTVNSPRLGAGNRFLERIRELQKKLEALTFLSKSCLLHGSKGCSLLAPPPSGSYSTPLGPPLYHNRGQEHAALPQAPRQFRETCGGRPIAPKPAQVGRTPMKTTTAAIKNAPRPQEIALQPVRKDTRLTGRLFTPRLELKANKNSRRKRAHRRGGRRKGAGRKKNAERGIPLGQIGSAMKQGPDTRKIWEDFSQRLHTTSSSGVSGGEALTRTCTGPSTSGPSLLSHSPPPTVVHSAPADPGGMESGLDAERVPGTPYDAVRDCISACPLRLPAAAPETKSKTGNAEGKRGGDPSGGGEKKEKGGVAEASPRPMAPPPRHSKRLQNAAVAASANTIQ